MAFYIGGKHRSLQDKKDTLQPWKKEGGAVHVNEDFIKVHGVDAHPDPEVKKFYTLHKLK